MKRLFLIVLCLLAVPAWAQVGPAPGVQLQDEGTGQGRVQTLNCVGSTIACTKSGVTGTLTLSGGGSGYATIEDEGTPQTQRTTVNFTGAGISCSDVGGKTVCNAGGGAGSANVVEVSLSLGTEMGLFYSTTVTGQSWVGASSVIACSMFGTTADGQTPETIAVAGMQPSVSDRVVGTGFNLNVYNPNGATGTVRAHCTGA